MKRPQAPSLLSTRKPTPQTNKNKQDRVLPHGDIHPVPARCKTSRSRGPTNGRQGRIDLSIPLSLPTERALGKQNIRPALEERNKGYSLSSGWTVDTGVAWTGGRNCRDNQGREQTTLRSYCPIRLLPFLRRDLVWFSHDEHRGIILYIQYINGYRVLLECT
jgi:hypothetical protein